MREEASFIPLTILKKANIPSWFLVQASIFSVTCSKQHRDSQSEAGERLDAVHSGTSGDSHLKVFKINCSG